MSNLQLPPVVTFRGVELAGAALCGLSNDPVCLHAGHPGFFKAPLRKRPGADLPVRDVKMKAKTLYK